MIKFIFFFALGFSLFLYLIFTIAYWLADQIEGFSGDKQRTLKQILIDQFKYIKKLRIW